MHIAYGNVNLEGVRKIGLSTLQVGLELLKLLSKHGIETEWNGDPDKRILVKLP